MGGANFAGMSVQFLCPSCGHPIEVDDEWAGRSVGCPYCRNTVTAPTASTYDRGDGVPTARVVEPGGGQPHLISPEVCQPGEWPPTVVQTDAPDSNSVAVWAFGLSCLFVLAWLVMGLLMGSRMEDALGPNPTQEEAYRFMNDHLQGGTIPGWLVGGFLALLLSLAFGVAALVCAILGVRLRRRRGFALAAFGLLGFFTFLMCAGVLLGQ